MRIYNGAILHATNKQNVAPGELGQVVSLDLGSVPEEVVTDKITPLIGQLANVLSEYKVYTWLSIGWREENTENKL